MTARAVTHGPPSTNAGGVSSECNDVSATPPGRRFAEQGAHRAHLSSLATMSFRGSRADHSWSLGTSLRPSYDGRMRSSGTSTRLTPLKLKSNSTRYVGGSAETR